MVGPLLGNLAVSSLELFQLPRGAKTVLSDKACITHSHASASEAEQPDGKATHSRNGAMQQMPGSSVEQ
jgi:hypothetical protein